VKFSESQIIQKVMVDGHSYSTELNKFILVEWQNENKFNVITRNSLCNPLDKARLDVDLIGTVVEAFFNKKRYDAKIIQCGKSTDFD